MIFHLISGYLHNFLIQERVADENDDDDFMEQPHDVEIDAPAEEDYQNAANRFHKIGPRRLVPVSSPNRASTGRYGFRKSGKSWIWAGHRSSVAARIWACDTSIASSRRDKTIGTGLSSGKSADPVIWLPEIRKILDDHGRRRAAKPLGSPMELATNGE
ncbi:hypothetical protein DdX_06509 [Ditylenchus destructor]|uniref:Uncharacterized protein n=1 Tax=Ditylenchus destructor TaxID=166010 RepID=A0AAD4N7R5_9BILA|nr:hypothetical protein DdX_06509 [Ditylenchus destructor]